MTNTLDQVRNAAVDRLMNEEWIQGEWGDGEGGECLHRAVRMCTPQVGDNYVLSAALDVHGYGPGWNDTKGRTKDDVLFMLKGIDPTDEWLEAAFGPSWRLVVAVIRQAAGMTAAQATKLAATRAAAWAARAAAASGDAWAAWDATRAAAWDAAGDAAGAATGAATGAAAWAATRDATGAAAWAATGAAAWAATRDAAWAAAVTDLIGKHGYTQQHHDTLMGPWREVFGHEDSWEGTE